MSISLDPSANYVSPRMWGIRFCGPLTDKKITRYQKQGYYGGGIVRQKAKRARKGNKPNVLKAMLNLYT